MSKLLPITIISIVLAWISQHATMGKRLPDGRQKKDVILFIILTVCMVFFVGLRTKYNDTNAYLIAFYNTDTSDSIHWIIGRNPGYQIVKKTCVELGFSAQSYLLLYAIFTISVYLWYVRKYSTNFGFSVFLLFMSGTYLFALAAMKQCAAIAFGLLAIDRYLRKRYLLAVVFILLGALFHPYVLMFLAVPFLNFRPWCYKTWFLIGGFIIIGFVLQPLIGTVVDITTLMGETFDSKDFLGEGVNPFRLAVSSVPFIISFLTRKIIQQEDNRVQNFFLNLSMLNTAIMFVGLFGTANYFARLANYFSIFSTISLPWLLKQFELQTKRLLTALTFFGYISYFLFENLFYRQFDKSYSAISVIKYLKSII